MNRFYLNIKSGEQILQDEEGYELPDLQAAYEKALEAARCLLVAAIESERSLDAEAVIVADSQGRSFVVSH